MDRDMLHTVERRKDNRIGHFMRKNGAFLKYVITGKREGTGRRGRRREQLPDDLKERRRY